MKSTSIAGLFAALTSSLCCIVPAIALIAGTGGAAASFGWLAPWRPYLFVFSVAALGVAWYQHLFPKSDACGCGVKKRGFWESRFFLIAITAGSVLALTFPTLSKTLAPTPELSLPNRTAYQVARFTVEGMTCAGCEQHVEKTVGQLAGVGQVRASYSLGNTTVAFDPRRTSPDQIRHAITTTGYRAVPAPSTNTP